MASKIEQGLSKVSGSSAPALSGVKGKQYTAANVKIRDVSSSVSKSQQLAASLDNFVNTSVKGANYYIDVQEKKASQNVKKIMASMSPEVIQAARADRTILAHDDPYTKAALNKALAAQESDSIYTEISKNMNAGLYKSREEMGKALTESLSTANKSRREAYGVSDFDESWDSGWASDVESKNIAMYQQMDGVLDQQAQNLAMTTNKVRNSQLVADEAMPTEDWVNAWRNGFNEAGHDGLIRDSKQKAATLGNMISGLVVTPKGAERLSAIADEQIEIDGAPMSVREFIGEDQWQNAVAKAEKSKFDMDWQTQKAFTSDLYDAEATEDMTLGLEQANGMLKTLEQETNPSPQTNAKKQEVLAAILRIKGRMQKETSLIRGNMVKENQKNTRSSELRKKYQSYLDGDITSTNWQDMPENEATGKYEKQDEVELANTVFNEIDGNKNLSEAQKIERKLQWIKASPKDSAFRSAFGKIIGDSSSEINAAIISGDTEADMSKTQRLHAIYASNKSTMMMLYPENAEQFAMLDLMGQHGVNSQTFIAAEALKKETRKDPNRQREMETNWQAVTNSRKELKYLPEQMRKVVRSVYDAAIYTGGDSSRAGEAAQEYVKANYESFAPNGGSDFIPKSALMVGNDPESANRSAEVIREQTTAALDGSPFVSPKSVTTSLLPDGGVWVRDATGEISMKFTPTLLRAALAEKDKEAAAKAKASTESGILKMKMKMGQVIDPETGTYTNRSGTAKGKIKRSN